MPDPYYQAEIDNAPYLATKADDWQMSMIGTAAFASYLGLGWFPFAFRSAKLDITEGFCLTAFGVGLGGNAASIGPDILENSSFSDVDLIKPFSILDLHQSPSRIASVSGGLKLGKKSVEKLTKLQKATHDKTSVGICAVVNDFFTALSYGPGLGSGLGAFAFAGFWYSFTLNRNSINPLRAIKDLWDHGQSLSGQMPTGDLGRFGPLSGIRSF